MKETINDFQTPAKFYQFCTKRIRDMAIANGNSPIALEALYQGLELRPDLVGKVISKSNQIARSVLEQNRENSSSLILYIDTALRAIASEDKPELLYPSRWDTNTLIQYFDAKGDEISELAGRNTLGRNLPQRAGWMLYLLNRNNLLSQNLYFIEVGAAAGYILDALVQPRKFVSWLESQTQQFSPELLSIKLPEASGGIGIDLVPPPNTRWALASLGDDEVIDSVQSFINTFPIRSRVIAGSILDNTSWETVDIAAELATSLGKRPVIIASEMLYQLAQEGRQEVLKRIQELVVKNEGLFIRSDGGQYMGLPEYEMYTIGELRDSRFELRLPRLLMKDKYRLDWEYIKE